jgi:hypothetical protein
METPQSASRQKKAKRQKAPLKMAPTQAKVSVVAKKRKAVPKSEHTQDAPPSKKSTLPMKKFSHVKMKVKIAPKPASPDSEASPANEKPCPTADDHDEKSSPTAEDHDEKPSSTADDPTPPSVDTKTGDGPPVTMLHEEDEEVDPQHADEFQPNTQLVGNGATSTSASRGFDFCPEKIARYQAEEAVEEKSEACGYSVAPEARILFLDNPEQMFRTRDRQGNPIKPETKSDHQLPLWSDILRDPSLCVISVHEDENKQDLIKITDPNGKPLRFITPAVVVGPVFPGPDGTTSSTTHKALMQTWGSNFDNLCNHNQPFTMKATPGIRVLPEDSPYNSAKRNWSFVEFTEDFLRDYLEAGVRDCMVKHGVYWKGKWIETDKRLQANEQCQNDPEEYTRRMEEKVEDILKPILNPTETDVNKVPLSARKSVTVSARLAYPVKKILDSETNTEVLEPVPVAFKDSEIHQAMHDLGGQYEYIPEIEIGNTLANPNRASSDLQFMDYTDMFKSGVENGSIVLFEVKVKVVSAFEKVYIRLVPCQIFNTNAVLNITPRPKHTPLTVVCNANLPENRVRARLREQLRKDGKIDIQVAWLQSGTFHAASTKPGTIATDNTKMLK